MNLERRLYQPFSLMGQDRSKSDPIDKIFADGGMGRGTKVGVIDWKYFEPEPGKNWDTRIHAPAYLVDTVREITGLSP